MVPIDDDDDDDYVVLELSICRCVFMTERTIDIHGTALTVMSDDAYDNYISY